MEANFQKFVTREERTTLKSLSSRSSGAMTYAKVIEKPVKVSSGYTKTKEGRVYYNRTRLQ